jgi:hypothetical protein
VTGTYFGQLDFRGSHKADVTSAECRTNQSDLGSYENISFGVSVGLLVKKYQLMHYPLAPDSFSKITNNQEAPTLKPRRNSNAAQCSEQTMTSTLAMRAVLPQFRSRSPRVPCERRGRASQPHTAAPTQTLGNVQSTAPALRCITATPPSRVPSSSTHAFFFRISTDSSSSSSESESSSSPSSTVRPTLWLSRRRCCPLCLIMSEIFL